MENNRRKPKGRPSKPMKTLADEVIEMEADKKKT
jgi:hypothetical protein